VITTFEGLPARQLRVKLSARHIEALLGSNPTGAIQKQNFPKAAPRAPATPGLLGGSRCLGVSTQTAALYFWQRFDFGRMLAESPPELSAAGSEPPSTLPQNEEFGAAFERKYGAPDWPNFA
jgi:hypothetical protein